MDRGNILPRPPASPLRTTSKLRLCGFVSSEDISNQRVTTSHTNQVHIAGSSKSHSKNAFESVYGPDAPPDSVVTSILPELLHSLFNGSDCAFMAFGGKSRGKENILYGGEETGKPGLLQTCVESIFRMMDESRAKRPDVRLQLRLSALLYSQRENSLTDLLSAFNSDPRRKSVKIAEDVENESAIRVESPEQALFYLNAAVDHRLVEDEETFRTNHLFLFFSLYTYKTTGNELEGGRRRLAFVDMGIGERNSQRGEMTMPVLGGFLLTLFQGQKHIPSRMLHEYMCPVWRSVIGVAATKPSPLLNSFAATLRGHKMKSGDALKQKLHLTGTIDNIRNGIAIAVSCLVQGMRIYSDIFRENNLSRLLRCSLASARITTLLFSFSMKTDDNENIVQLASKLSRVKRNRSHTKASETGSVRSGTRSELESGSEMSAAETVIYVGPRPLHRSNALPPRSPSVCSKVTQTTDSSKKTTVGSVPPMLKDVKGHTPFMSATLKLYDDLCSPPGTSNDVKQMFGEKTVDSREDFGITIVPPKRSPSRHNLGDEKRMAIMQWMESCEPIMVDEERLPERMQSECIILSHPLEDIIEIDEESMKDSTKSRGTHPLRILSKEAINQVDSTEKAAALDFDEDALERAMEASISSIKSHEILSKLQSPDLSTPVSLKEATVSLTTGTPSEMDLYRRASHLEEYAMERMKEMDEEKLKKKKSRLNLNCCQNSMLSSGSTVVDWATLEKKRQAERERAEETRRRDELKARREQLKLEEDELRRERYQIDKELQDRPFPLQFVRQISQQLHSLNVTKPNTKARGPSDSLPTTPTVSHKKITPCRTPSLTNCSSLMSPVVPVNSSKLLRKETPRKSSKSREKRERRNSEGKTLDDPVLRSPYTKVTVPRITTGTASSGRGSDDNASETMKGKKRQSYSASSGYESGCGDYYSFYKDNRLERLKAVDRRLQLGKEVEHLRETQKHLRRELQAAKARIGQVDDGRSICHEKSLSGLSQTTLIDALTQENRILEKRLIACQNHTMLITSFL